MLKIALVLCSLMLSGLSFAAQQVDLIGPKDVPIPAGWSSWTVDLPQPIVANPLRISFWNTGNCRVIPVTNVSIKYKNSPYWISTEFRSGFYYVGGGAEVSAIKLDLYQNQVPHEVCAVKISGYVP